MIIKDILKTLKVNHYIKNLTVIIPLLFSMNILHIDLWIKCLIIFIGFCLISSAVYVLNDLIDIENDKKHPIKCNRPIASGRISKPFAIAMLLLLLIASLAITSKLNNLCILMIVSYFVLNIFYSIWLKKIALIDVTCIAVGFILRIVGGCFAIGVLPSPLVILMTFFVSNFFTCTKRRLELQFSETETRKSLKEFNIATANQFILINAVLSISFYITYVLDASTIQKAGSEYLYLTVIPFTLIIYRLFLLINSAQIADDPIIYLEKDKTVKWLAAIYLFILLIVLIVLK
ncbi:MAG: UbiA prenyltransferase family protein [Candidatus Gastranaerophilaceae bacterium]